MPAKGKPVFQTDSDEHPIESRFEIRSDRWPPAQRCEAIKNPRWKANNGEGRCKRFATRGGRYCELHHPDREVYQAVMKAEVAKMTDARELILEARQFIHSAQTDLMTAAPIAVSTIVEIAQNPDISPAVRVKAADLLIRHSGASLERHNETNVSVTIGNPDLTAIISQRLDRLAAAADQDHLSVISGELAPRDQT